MSEKMTTDKAMTRVMELHKVYPGDDVMRRELRKLLSDLSSASWSEGYQEGRSDAQG